MFKLVYFINKKTYIHYFDDFDDLLFFIDLAFFVCNSFGFIKIYNLRNGDVIYDI